MHKKRAAKQYVFEIVKFFFVGGLCTLLTYLIYLLLLFVCTYKIAYTCAYVIGIVLSYFLNSAVTFKQNYSLKKFLLFPSVYLVQYVVGILLLRILVENFAIDKVYAPIMVIIVTLPITFLLSRNILVKKNKTQKKEQDAG